MKKNIRNLMFLVLMVLSLVLTVGCEDSSDTGVNKPPVVVENVKEVEGSSPVVDLPLVIEEIEVSDDIFQAIK